MADVEREAQLPVNVARGHSHMAMKTLGGGGLVGGRMASNRGFPTKRTIPDRISLEDNFHFILSQPITT